MVRRSEHEADAGLLDAAAHAVRRQLDVHTQRREHVGSARLPGLARGTPAPATIKAAQVEMLKEPEASPPVPTTSIASGGAITRSIFSRIAVTAPVISSTVSPRTRNAINRAPICEG